MSKLFSEIHRGLPREGPGCTVSTRNAFLKLPDITSQVELLDIGCGPGLHTIELANLLSAHNGTITATDVNQSYLDALKSEAKQKSIQNVQCEIADMFDLKFQDKFFDIIWAEGAIFIIGFEKGLLEWKRVLKDNGFVVVSELSWIKDNAPEEIKTFWSQAYSKMNTIESNLAIANKCGFSVIDHFTLPTSGWFDDYYVPMESRIEELRGDYAGNGDATKMLDDSMIEIDMYKKYSAFYGYEFYVMKAKNT